MFLVRGDDQTRDGELVSSQQADFGRIRRYELDTRTTNRDTSMRQNAVQHRLTFNFNRMNLRPDHVLFPR